MHNKLYDGYNIKQTPYKKRIEKAKQKENPDQHSNYEKQQNLSDYCASEFNDGESISKYFCTTKEHIRD